MSVPVILAVAHQTCVLTMMGVMTASARLNLLTKREIPVLILMSAKKQTSNVVLEKFVLTTILLSHHANALKALMAPSALITLMTVLPMVVIRTTVHGRNYAQTVLTAGHAVVGMVLSKTITEIVLISIAVLMKISAKITMIAITVTEVIIVAVKMGSPMSVIMIMAKFVKMSMSVMMLVLINAQLILIVKTPMVDFHVTVMMGLKPTLITHLSAQMLTNVKLIFSFVPELEKNVIILKEAHPVYVQLRVILVLEMLTKTVYLQMIVMESPVVITNTVWTVT